MFSSEEYSFINIDVIIVAAFLILNLGVGIYKSRGIKTMDQYALGGRNFTTATLAATIIATWIGGDNFALHMSETYKEGLYYILSSFAVFGSFLIVSYVFAPRLKGFLGSMSIAVAMGKLYGKRVRVITAISGFIAIITMVAMQFKLLSSLLVYFFGISGVYATIISSMVIVVYSSLGGIKAVTFTDIVQFFTFGTIIPIITIIIWGTIDSPDLVLSSVAGNPQFDYNVLFDFNNPKFWSFISLFLFFLIPGFDPSVFQRMSMAKNHYQLTKAFSIAALVILVIQLLISWMAVLILSENGKLDPNHLLSYIIDEHSYEGFKGLIMIGVMSMIMSTADSDMNAGAVLFTHDICKPFGIANEDNELLLSRISSFLIGIFAIILAVTSSNLFELFLLGYSFYMPIVTVPFILAALGFESTEKSILIGMGAGFITAMIWPYVGYDVDNVIPGVFSNLIFLIGSHYLLRQSGGWIGVKDDSALQEIKNIRKRRYREIISCIKNFNFVEMCKNNRPKNDSTYAVFGIFCMISVFSTMYSMPFELRQEYDSILGIIYNSVLFTATAFLTYPIWPQILKNDTFIAILWVIGLFYTLAFISGLQVAISNFGQFQLMTYLVSMIMLAALLRWRLALFMIIAGGFSGIQFFKWYAGIETINTEFGSLQFKIMYLLLLISSILLIFFKPQQEHLAETENKVGELGEKVNHFSQKITDQQQEISRLEATGQRIINNVNHELRLPVGNVMNFAEMIHSGLENLSKPQLKEISSEVYKNSTRLSSMILNMLDLSALKADELQLQKKPINFSELVEDRANGCRKMYLDGKQINFEFYIEPNIFINVDPNYMRQIVDNLVINSIKYSEKGTITITVNSDDNHVYLDVSDEGIGIPKYDIYDIFKPFTVSSKTLTPAEGRGVGLALCMRAIKAHGGDIEAYSDGSTGATFKCILPK